MSKMGLYDPFGYLKHKLWPKNKSGSLKILEIGIPKTLEADNILWKHLIEVRSKTKL